MGSLFFVNLWYVLKFIGLMIVLLYLLRYFLFMVVIPHYRKTYRVIQLDGKPFFYDSRFNRGGGHEAIMMEKTRFGYRASSKPFFVGTCSDDIITGIRREYAKGTIPWIKVKNEKGGV